jgi:superfamily II DNA or RNA helicase
MLLENRCGHEFDETTKTRGRGYARGGRVSLVNVDGTRATARVSGSYNSPYHVELDWSDVEGGVISGRCSCPRFADGFLCKHLWATLMELDKKGHSRLVPGSRRIEIVDFEDDEDFANDTDDDFWDDNEGEWDDGWDATEFAVDEDDREVRRELLHHLREGSVQSAADLRRLVTQGVKSSPKTWRHVLRRVDGPHAESDAARQIVQAALDQKGRLAWYVIHVALSQQRRELVVELAQQERLKDGAFGKQKKLSIHEEMLPQFRDPVDQRVLAWALRDDLDSDDDYYFGYYGGPTRIRTIEIPARSYADLLPELAGTGRLLWALNGADSFDATARVAWDSEPWTFRPRVEAASGRKTGWSLDGTLVRGGELRPLSDVILAIKHGLVLFPDCLAQLATSECLPLLEQLQASGPLTIPKKDREDFLELIYRLPYCDAIELPDELRLPAAEVTPQPLMRIKAPAYDSYGRGELLGEICFRYGEELLPLDDPRERVLDSEPKRLLVRNRAAEAERLVALRDLPVRLAAPFDGSPGELRVDRTQLRELVSKLIERGWDVEAEGALIRRPGNYNIEVTSNVDWFELNASVDYDGVAVKLPALLAALRRGDKYIRLDDGSQGMLPEAWLARFDKLMHLADENKDSIRFAPSQALLLDALLAEQENVRTDLSFRKFRDKLRSFGGVRPANAPRGFDGELRDYQKSGLGWFAFLQDMGFGGCLADDMGLGKTVQVLGLLQQRRARRVGKGDRRRPSLCVVPKSLVFNWIDEAQRFAPRLNVVNYTGLDRKARQEELDNTDLIVTTYGTLRRDVVDLKDKRFDYVILDEAQAIKNHNSQAAKACRLLSADHRLALTGTPIENHLGELWSLFEFINPGMLGSCTAFASLCRGTRAGGNGNGHSEALTDLSKAIAPFVLRRTKEQVLKELPEKSEQTIHCELSKRERKEYDELRDFYRAQLSKQIDDVGLEKSKIHVLEALLRLRQAACHPGLLDQKMRGQSSAKLDALLEQLHEAVEGGHKALVFSQFVSLLSIVRERLDKEGIVYEYLDGQTTKRKSHVERFQNDPNCPLFLISLKAGGHGLNLTAADYVFILDPWWNPAVEMQAIDRTHRIGQTRRVFAYRLIAKDTVEEKVVELQKQKRELADAIITANESLIRKLTAEDLQEILS